MANVTNPETLAAYRQVGQLADAAADQQLRGLVDQRIDLDRQVQQAHARVEELRAERERATGGITTRVAQQALSGAVDDADDGDADVRNVATAAARIPAAQARLDGLRLALDRLEMRIEQHLRTHAASLHAPLVAQWADHAERAAAMRRQADAAQRQADDARALVYVGQPGPLQPAQVEGVTMPRRKTTRPGTGFADLGEPPSLELLAAGAGLPGGRLTPSIAAHRKAEERLLMQRAVEADQGDDAEPKRTGVASWQ